MHPGMNIRRHVLRAGAIWLLFILIASVSCAQVSIGLYAGADLTKFSGTIPGKLTYANKFGYALGLSTTIKLFDDVHLSLRPGFNQNGTAVTSEETSSFNPLSDSLLFFEVTTKAVQLPTLFIVNVSKSFYAIGGLQTSYIVSAEADVYDDNYDVLPNFNVWQFQGVFGFGFGLNSKRINADIELSYMQGLNTLTQEKYIDDGSVPRIRSQGFRASLFFAIGTTGKNKNE